MTKTTNMKKYIAGFALFCGVILASFGLLAGNVNTAFAMTPTLSLSNSNNSDTVQITVNGDSNSIVSLYYQRSGYGMQTQYIGTTNSSGYLSTTVSTSSYGVTQGSYAYVIVNNQQSSSVLWPYSGSGGGNLTLSLTNVTLSQGQSSTITASNTGGYNISANGNSNPNVASSVIYGNQITIAGISAGSTTMNFCAQNYQYSGSNCANVYVTVQSGYYYGGGGSVTLSPNSTSLIVGQTTNITVSGGYPPYNMYVSGTSNIFQAALSNNTLTITGLAIGSSTLSVCSTGTYTCATLSVTVNNSSNYNYNYNYNYQNPYQYQDGWTFCANENQNCYFSGSQTVRYGANGRYYYRTLSGSTWCSNSTFGDPIFGTAKQCSYGGSIPAGYTYDPYYGSYNTSSYYPQVATNYYQFTRTMTLGSIGEDVKELQRRLTLLEVYSGPITGYFGKLTTAGVKRYQATVGLSQTGTLNSATVSSLNYR